MHQSSQTALQLVHVDAAPKLMELQLGDLATVYLRFETWMSGKMTVSLSLLLMAELQPDGQSAINIFQRLKEGEMSPVVGREAQTETQSFTN